MWGESIDASKAKLFPLPSEDDEEGDGGDEEVVTSLPVPAPTSTQGSGAGAGETGNPASTTDATADRPTGTTDPEEAAQSTTASNSTWLPSFLPTFGVSARTQAWIYGALVLIVIFCCGLGVYLWMARRKRLRNSNRDDYEFELLDEEEAEGLNSGEKGGGGGGQRARKTRGGELYDAFAGGSDDEDDLDVGGYRDRDDSRDREARMSEKRGAARRGGDEEEDGVEEDLQHHVIGSDDEDDDEEDGVQSDSDRRPLRR